jgi:peptidoglycan/LPS O-acetylase OafA/YrhL
VSRRAAAAEERGQIPVLDGVRGLAILLVLAFHENVVEGEHVTTAFDRWFFSLVGVGWCGVDLFFVLSGFLITGILLDAKGGARYFRNFYARRTLRIFPLYYAVCFLSLVVIPNLPAGVVPAANLERLGRIEGDEIWYWLYLSNVAIARAGVWRHGILDVSWSLAIEEQFYLLWPALVAGLGRVGLARVCVGLLIGAPSLRLLLSLAGAGPMAILVATPARLDPLALGALIALAARGPAGLGALAPAARWVFGATLALLAGWFLWRGSLDGMEPAVQVAGYGVLAWNFGALLVLVLLAPAGSFANRLFASRFLRLFGKYSYAIYLFHLPVRAALRDTVYGPDEFVRILGSMVPGQFLFYAISTPLALGLAMLSWVLLERRCLALKRHFPNARRRARGAAGPGDAPAAGFSG